MNTKQLQKTFTHMYEEFYGKQKVIYSAPFFFSRNGETRTRSVGPAIKQKIPLRMYIGITPSEIPGIQRGNCTVYDMYEKQFVTTPIIEYIRYSSYVTQFVEMYVKKYGGKSGEVMAEAETSETSEAPKSPKSLEASETPLANGYVISLLSELPDGMGLGFDSVFSLLVATVLQKIYGTVATIPTRDCVVPKDMSYTTRCLNDEKHETYSLLRIAHAIGSAIVGEIYLDGGVATSLLPGALPIVSFHEDIYVDPKNTGQKELLEVYDYKYFALSLPTLYPSVSPNTSLPVDCGLVYSGRPLVTENRVTSTSQGTFHKIMHNMPDTIKPYLTATCAKRKPKFCKHLFAKYTDDSVHVADGMIGYMSFEMLDALRAIGEKGHTEEQVKNVIQLVTKMRHVHNIAKQPATYLTKILDAIYQQMGYRTEHMGFCYNDSSNMGGSFLFVSPMEAIRNDMIQAVFSLQRSVSGVEMLYTSWKDGHEDVGLVCEQDLFAQKNSLFINDSLLRLDVVGRGAVFGSYEELVKTKDVDIVLDTVNMKMYACGEKLTSKELHSQLGTIEMLITTMQNIGCDISNKQLPLSSYSKSKNDMVGKIITPLTRLVKERMNKDLPIECYGSMYEYYLKLKKNNVKIGIMRKAVEN